MPRQARAISPTNYYHIMMRGINKEKIFLGKGQKIFFMKLFAETMTEESIEIVSYCLMDNHIHIVAQGEINELSKAIKNKHTICNEIQ